MSTTNTPSVGCTSSNYPRPTKLLTTFIVICIVLAIPCTLFVSFLLAQEFGQASVKACCCIEESHHFVPSLTLLRSHK